MAVKKVADWCRQGQGQNDVKGHFSLYDNFVNVDKGLTVRLVLETDCHNVKANSLMVVLSMSIPTILQPAGPFFFLAKLITIRVAPVLPDKGSWPIMC